MAKKGREVDGRLPRRSFLKAVTAGAVTGIALEGAVPQVLAQTSSVEEPASKRGIPSNRRRRAVTTADANHVLNHTRLEINVKNVSRYFRKGS